MIGPVFLMMSASFGVLRSARGHERYLFLFAGCAAIAGVMLLLLGSSRPYLAWNHRRRQRASLAKIDAEIASLESEQVRVEIPSLEAAQIRIAELEAEEAAVEPDELARGIGRAH